MFVCLRMTKANAISVFKTFFSRSPETICRAVVLQLQGKLTFISHTVRVYESELEKKKGFNNKGFKSVNILMGQSIQNKLNKQQLQFKFIVFENCCIRLSND